VMSLAVALGAELFRVITSSPALGETRASCTVLGGGRIRILDLNGDVAGLCHVGGTHRSGAGIRRVAGCSRSFAAKELAALVAVRLAIAALGRIAGAV
jgi:hypothetical protein